MKLKLHFILLLFYVVCLPLLSFSQRTITGTVTDQGTGETLIGANILVENTSSGTVTDFDGTYTLEVPAGATNLIFSYTGYADKVIPIGASNVIDVAMSAGAILEEVVVIGYGTVKREDATGSIQSVGTESFNRGAITGPQELLAGKIAGVVITPSADPGGGAAIRIRGGSSLSANNDPLVVVDGIPFDNNGAAGTRNILNTINPNDIKTFTVLKDASATAIYGSRASNGVILITTKKGSVGTKLQVDYNGNVSFSNIINKVDVLDANAFREVITEQFGAESTPASLLGNANTDWQDEIYETALGTDHNLSLSGTVDNALPYRLSLGYTNKNGVLMSDNFQRTSASLNLSPSFLDNRLQMNINMKGSVENNNFANRGAIGSAVVFDPTQPVNSGNSNFGGYYTWLQSNGNPNVLAPANPLALLNLREDQSDVSRFILNGSLDYRFGFLPELRANLNLGYDRSEGKGTVNVPAEASFAFVNGGEQNEYDSERQNELLEFYLNYAKEWGGSNLEVMGGYSWQHFYRNNSFYNSNLDGTIITADDNPREQYLVSLFGRVNYSPYDRLLLTFTSRWDASSRFSPETRWGFFPAAAAAYKVISNDPSDVLSNMKLRFGFGITGQQDIGDDLYPYLPRYLFSFDNAQYQFGNEYIFTSRPQGYDANIKWEETTTINIGVDFGFRNDRVYGTLEVYDRKTKDLLNFIPVPAGTNLTNFINTNVGDLENQGVELTLNMAPIDQKYVKWDFGFNVAYNKNRITKLTASDDPNYQGVLTGGISGGVGSTIQIHSVGYPANSYYVYEQVYDEQGIPVEGLYVDRNRDGVINAGDQYRAENPTPDYTVGFTSNFTYHKWDFSFAGRGNVGNYNYNNMLSNNAVYGFLRHPTDYLLNQLSAIRDIDFQNPQYLSDLYLQNASFLRVDHMTLGYNFDTKGKAFKNMRAFATVQNPILITNYDGLDPEIFGGIDNNNYPRARTVVFGLNAGF